MQKKQKSVELDSQALANEQESGVSRRDVLKASAGAAAIAGAGSLFPSEALAMGSGVHPVFGLSRVDRREMAFKLRCDTAAFYVNLPNSVSGPDVQPVSGDEGLYDDFRGSFSKTLRHNGVGEVNVNSYNAYLNALDTGDPLDFENIPVGAANNPDRVRLVSPQAAYAYEMFGVDGNDPRMDAAPAFASAETAAEMGELYWYALTRDIPFTDYGASQRIEEAVKDLNNFSRSDIFPNVGGS
ncbi:MAG: twin-arginine translocation signal domain-containing protein, partial [Acidobacteriota bacterium]